MIDIWVATKSDLSPTVRSDENWIACSSATGEGIDVLCNAIFAALSCHDAEEIGSVVGTAARCNQASLNASEAIATAIKLIEKREGHELIAAELRICAACLGEVTGEVYTDDILNRVFGRFCIGK